MTHICQNNALKLAICKTLGWDEGQYATLQYNMGLQYLCLYYADHFPTIDMMQRSALYWNWWKNKWAQRDEHFMDRFNSLPTWQPYSVSSRVSDYYAMNDARELVHNIRPAQVILHAIGNLKTTTYG